MTLDTRPLRIARRALDHPDALLLVEEVQAEYVELYGSPDEAPIDVAEFEGEAGAFLVAYVDEVPVASGAWRFVATPLSLGGEPAGRSAELKRMFVRREHRRRGHAARMLAEVEQGARTAGARFAVLETGPLQLAAVGLYRAAGYRPLADFGHYQHMGAHSFVRELV